MPCLISPHLTSSYLKLRAQFTTPHLTSPRLVSPHLTSLRLTAHHQEAPRDTHPPLNYIPDSPRSAYEKSLLPRANITVQFSFARATP
ncbi:hypothetical protein M0804_009819 [Polistes exclamans]|nr:hypothetical protein M0804_009819 [Polistes exclamans]